MTTTVDIAENDDTDVDDREVKKPCVTAFPFGFRTARSNSVLILDFLDDKDSFAEVISSTALDKTMAADIVERLNRFISSVEKSQSDDE